MESCSRKIHFCYGHRVMNHESKCATLHGHNGVVWVHATPCDGLDSLGRVVDFSVLKEKVGGWVDKYWDHTTILFDQDEKTIDLIDQCPKAKDTFVMNVNPTAENMANFLLREVCPKALEGTGVVAHKIVFWETENCFAEQTLESNDLESAKVLARKQLK